MHKVCSSDVNQSPPCFGTPYMPQSVVTISLSNGPLYDKRVLCTNCNVFNNTSTLYRLYWCPVAPWRLSRQTETCRSYHKSCVKIYIILTLVHLLVLLSELFNTAYLLSGYPQFESRPAGALTILRFSWFSSKFKGAYWKGTTTTSYQFTVYKANSSIRSAPRTLQIAPTNQPSHCR
jgi:hypothetical protein